MNIDARKLEQAAWAAGFAAVVERVENGVMIARCTPAEHNQVGNPDMSIQLRLDLTLRTLAVITGPYPTRTKYGDGTAADRLAAVNLVNVTPPGPGHAFVANEGFFGIGFVEPVPDDAVAACIKRAFRVSWMCGINAQRKLTRLFEERLLEQAVQPKSSSLFASFGVRQ